MIKYLYLSVFILLLTAGCHKQVKLPTASEQLVGKVWYLEKLVTSSNSFSYRGVSTFSFSLERGVNIYRDSDGVMGTFIIQELPHGAWVLVNSTNRIIEPLKVTQLEKDHFVAEVLKSNDLQILYFSVRP